MGQWIKLSQQINDQSPSKPIAANKTSNPIIVKTTKQTCEEHF